MEFSLPYGRIKSTLGKAYKFVAPARNHMIAGAVVGGAAGMMGGNGNTMRDAGIGALAGFGASGIGRNMLRVGRRAARAESGVFNASAGVGAMKTQAMRMWKGL